MGQRLDVHLTDDGYAGEPHTVILDHRDRRTADFEAGERVRAFQGFDRQGWKRLDILSAATGLDDLRSLPSNRLEVSRGDRAGQFSIRIDDRWRICFEWPAGQPRPSRVEIVDHHQPSRQLRRIEAVSRPPIHPGEILADELEELGITPTELSRQIKVTPNRVTQIIQGKRSITGDTALRLGHWFGNSPEFWLNLQSAYDLRLATQAAGAEIEALPVRPQAGRQAIPARPSPS